MKDEFILRIAEETSKVLSGMQFHESCSYLLPSYNALLLAAKANHPDDEFLSALSTIKLNGDEESGPGQLHILLTQLRIALESLQGEGS